MLKGTQLHQLVVCISRAHSHASGVIRTMSGMPSITGMQAKGHEEKAPTFRATEGRRRRRKEAERRSDDDRIAEARALAPLVEDLHRRYVNGVIAAPDFVAAYLLLFACYRKPKAWIAGPLQPPAHTITAEAPHVPFSPNSQPQGDDDYERLKQSSTRISDLQPLDQLLTERMAQKIGGRDVTVCEVWSSFRLSGVPPYANTSIVQWALGRRPMDLLFHVPSSTSVLQMQAQGRRCVTAFVTEAALSVEHTGKDAMEFAIHDLKHMEKFVESQFHLEQIGFFASLLSLPQRPKAYFAGLGPSFWPDLQYVISDMNGCVVHLLSYLRAKWLIAEDKLQSPPSEPHTNSSPMPLAAPPSITTYLCDCGLEPGTPAWGAAEKAGTGPLTAKEGEALRAFFRERGEGGGGEGDVGEGSDERGLRRDDHWRRSRDVCALRLLDH